MDRVHDDSSGPLLLHRRRIRRDTTPKAGASQPVRLASGPCATTRPGRDREMIHPACRGNGMSHHGQSMGRGTRAGRGLEFLDGPQRTDTALAGKPTACCCSPGSPRDSESHLWGRSTSALTRSVSNAILYDVDTDDRAAASPWLALKVDERRPDGRVRAHRPGEVGDRDHRQDRRGLGPARTLLLLLGAGRDDLQRRRTTSPGCSWRCGRRRCVATSETQSWRSRPRLRHRLQADSDGLSLQRALEHPLAFPRIATPA